VEPFINALQMAGPLGLAQVAAAAVAGLTALVAGGVLVAGLRFPAAVALTPLAMAPCLAIVDGISDRIMVFEAVAHASAETRMTLMAAGIASGLHTQLLAGAAVVLPGLLLMLACAAAGAMRGPRRAGLPALAATLTIAIAAVTLTGGLLSEQVMSGAIRSGIYLLGGLLVAVALTGADRSTSGPMAGATAALALPLVVGTAEMSALSMSQILTFEAVAHASAETKSMMLQSGLDWVDRSRIWAHLAMGGATLVALAGVAGAWPDADKSPGWLQVAVAAGLVLALPFCLAAPVALWLDPTPLLDVMSLGMQ